MSQGSYAGDYIGLRVNSLIRVYISYITGYIGTTTRDVNGDTLWLK